MKNGILSLNYLNIVVLLLLSTTSLAGEFTLFDPERGRQPPPLPESSKPVLPPPQPVIPPPPPKPLPPQKDLVLQGISQIGNKYFLVLQTPDNKTHIQPWEHGKTPLKKIDGFQNYSLLKVTSKTVQLSYPEDAPCQKHNPGNGLICEEGGKTASLNLKSPEAISLPPPPPSQPQPVAANNPFVAAQTQVPQVTEAELQERQRKFEERRKLYENFQKQVIEDKDIPPGMKRIRTPFGDRLVPDRR